MRSSWNRRSWRPTTQTQRWMGVLTNSSLFIGHSCPWKDGSEQTLPIGAGMEMGTGIWPTEATTLYALSHEGFLSHHLPSSHTLKIFIRSMTSKKKNSTLYNVRKYTSITLRKKGLEHLLVSSQKLPWPDLSQLQKSMCIKMPDLGQIPQTLLICSWSVLLVACLEFCSEFSILFQMELPVPRVQGHHFPAILSSYCSRVIVF